MRGGGEEVEVKGGVEGRAKKLQRDSQVATAGHVVLVNTA